MKILLNFLHGKSRILYITPRGFHASSEVVIYDLEREGYEITRADDIEQAKAIYQETRPDLVLLEMRPFTGDGLEDLAEMLAVDKDMKTLLISEYQNPKEHILVPFLSAFVYYGDVIDG